MRRKNGKRKGGKEEEENEKDWRKVKGGGEKVRKGGKRKGETGIIWESGTRKRKGKRMRKKK